MAVKNPIITQHSEKLNIQIRLFSVGPRDMCWTFFSALPLPYTLQTKVNNTCVFRSACLAGKNDIIT